MIIISPTLSLEDSEINLEFIRAGGPGGQNVNKVATAVQLRFDVRNSPSLPAGVKQRLTRLAGRQLVADGVLLIEARRYRTQERNRADAILRLITLIQKALEVPKRRRPTLPTFASQTERLQAKRRRSATKQLRRNHPDD